MSNVVFGSKTLNAEIGKETKAYGMPNRREVFQQ